MAIPAPEKIEQLLGPVVATRELDIEEVKVVRAGAKSQIVVSVDGENNLSLDDLEVLTQLVSEALDGAEREGVADFGAGYTLEVTTRGVDAPLKAPRHWSRNRGRRVAISLIDGTALDGLIAALSDAGDEVIVVTSKGPKGRLKVTHQVLRLAEVAQAVVQVEFAAAPEKERELAELDFGAAREKLEDDK